MQMLKKRARRSVSPQNYMYEYMLCQLFSVWLNINFIAKMLSLPSLQYEIKWMSEGSVMLVGNGNYYGILVFSISLSHSLSFFSLTCLCLIGVSCCRTLAPLRFVYLHFIWIYNWMLCGVVQPTAAAFHGRSYESCRDTHRTVCKRAVRRGRLN